MEELLKGSFIELHESLSEFAKHYRDKGGQEAHKLINETLLKKFREAPRDGSPTGLARAEGYEQALKDVLSLLYKNYVP